MGGASSRTRARIYLYCPGIPDEELEAIGRTIEASGARVSVITSDDEVHWNQYQPRPGDGFVAVLQNELPEHTRELLLRVTQGAIPSVWATLMPEENTGGNRDCNEFLLENGHAEYVDVTIDELRELVGRVVDEAHARLLQEISTERGEMRHEDTEELRETQRHYLSWMIRQHNTLSIPGLGSIPGAPSVRLEHVYVVLRCDKTDSSERIESRIFLEREARAYAEEQNADWDALQADEKEQWTRRYLAQHPLAPSLQRQAEQAESKPAAKSGSESEVVLDGADLQGTTSMMLGEVIQRERRVVILGDPGSGKTTLCRWLCLKLALALRDGQERVFVPRRELMPSCPPSEANVMEDIGLARLPVLVQMTEFVTYLDQHPDGSLWQFLGHHPWKLEYASYEDGSRIPGDALHRLIMYYRRRRRLVVILDGLDELGDRHRRERVVRAVGSVIDQFTFPGSVDPTTTPRMDVGNQVVVTSRIAGYHQAPLQKKITHVTVEPMTPAAIRWFCEAWMRAVHDSSESSGTSASGIDESTSEQRAEALKEALFSPKRHPSVLQLAANPLLLTVMASIFLRRKEIPERRLELYLYSIKYMIEVWPESELKEKNIGSILPGLAFDMHDRCETGYMPEEMFLEQCAVLLAPTASDRASTLDAARSFLQTVQQSVGLICERGDGMLAFVHLSFQEFLAGQHMVASGDIQQTTQVMRSRITNRRWHEPAVYALAWAQHTWSEEKFDQLIEALLETRNDTLAGVLPKAALLTVEALDELRNVSGKTVRRICLALLTAYCQHKTLWANENLRAQLEMAFAQLLMEKDGHGDIAENVLLAALNADRESICAASSLLLGVVRKIPFESAIHDTAQVCLALLKAVQKRCDQSAWDWPISTLLRVIVRAEYIDSGTPYPRTTPSALKEVPKRLSPSFSTAGPPMKHPNPRQDAIPLEARSSLRKFLQCRRVLLENNDILQAVKDDPRLLRAVLGLVGGSCLYQAVPALIRANALISVIKHRRHTTDDQLALYRNLSCVSGETGDDILERLKEEAALAIGEVHRIMHHAVPKFRPLAIVRDSPPLHQLLMGELTVDGLHNVESTDPHVMLLQLLSEQSQSLIGLDRVVPVETTQLAAQALNDLEGEAVIGGYQLWPILERTPWQSAAMRITLMRLTGSEAAYIMDQLSVSTPWSKVTLPLHDSREIQASCQSSGAAVHGFRRPSVLQAKRVSHELGYYEQELKKLIDRARGSITEEFQSSIMAMVAKVSESDARGTDGEIAEVFLTLSRWNARMRAHLLQRAREHALAVDDAAVRTRLLTGILHEATSWTMFADVRDDLMTSAAHIADPAEAALAFARTSVSYRWNERGQTIMRVLEKCADIAEEAERAEVMHTVWPLISSMITILSCSPSQADKAMKADIIEAWTSAQNSMVSSDARSLASHRLGDLIRAQHDEMQGKTPHDEVYAPFATASILCDLLHHAEVSVLSMAAHERVPRDEVSMWRDFCNPHIPTHNLAYERLAQRRRTGPIDMTLEAALALDFMFSPRSCSSATHKKHALDILPSLMRPEECAVPLIRRWIFDEGSKASPLRMTGMLLSAERKGCPSDEDVESCTLLGSDDDLYRLRARQLVQMGFNVPRTKLWPASVIGPRVLERLVQIMRELWKQKRYICVAIRWGFQAVYFEDAMMAETWLRKAEHPTDEETRVQARFMVSRIDFSSMEVFRIFIRGFCQTKSITLQWTLLRTLSSVWQRRTSRASRTELISTFALYDPKKKWLNALAYHLPMCGISGVIQAACDVTPAVTNKSEAITLVHVERCHRRFLDNYSMRPADYLHANLAPDTLTRVFYAIDEQSRVMEYETAYPAAYVNHHVYHRTKNPRAVEVLIMWLYHALEGDADAYMRSACTMSDEEGQMALSSGLGARSLFPLRNLHPDVHSKLLTDLLLAVQGVGELSPATLSNCASRCPGIVQRLEETSYSLSSYPGRGAALRILGLLGTLGESSVECIQKGLADSAFVHDAAMQMVDSVRTVTPEATAELCRRFSARISHSMSRATATLMSVSSRLVGREQLQKEIDTLAAFVRDESFGRFGGGACFAVFHPRLLPTPPAPLVWDAAYHTLVQLSGVVQQNERVRRQRVSKKKQVAKELEKKTSEMQKLETEARDLDTSSAYRAVVQVMDDVSGPQDAPLIHALGSTFLEFANSDAKWMELGAKVEVGVAIADLCCSKTMSMRQTRYDNVVSKLVQNFGEKSREIVVSMREMRQLLEKCAPPEMHDAVEGIKKVINGLVASALGIENIPRQVQLCQNGSDKNVLLFVQSLKQIFDAMCDVITSEKSQVNSAWEIVSSALISLSFRPAVFPGLYPVLVLIVENAVARGWAIPSQLSLRVLEDVWEAIHALDNADISCSDIDYVARLEAINHPAAWARAVQYYMTENRPQEGAQLAKKLLEQYRNDYWVRFSRATCLFNARDFVECQREASVVLATSKVDTTNTTRLRCLASVNLSQHENALLDVLSLWVNGAKNTVLDDTGDLRAFYDTIDGLPESDYRKRFLEGVKLLDDSANGSVAVENYYRAREMFKEVKESRPLWNGGLAGHYWTWGSSKILIHAEENEGLEGVRPVFEEALQTPDILPVVHTTAMDFVGVVATDLRRYTGDHLERYRSCYEALTKEDRWPIQPTYNHASQAVRNLERCYRFCACAMNDFKYVAESLDLLFGRVPRALRDHEARTELRGRLSAVNAYETVVDFVTEVFQEYSITFTIGGKFISLRRMLQHDQFLPALVKRANQFFQLVHRSSLRMTFAESTGAVLGVKVVCRRSFWSQATIPVFDSIMTLAHKNLHSPNRAGSVSVEIDELMYE